MLSCINRHNNSNVQSWTSKYAEIFKNFKEFLVSDIFLRKLSATFPKETSEIVPVKFEQFHAL